MEVKRLEKEILKGKKITFLQHRKQEIIYIICSYNYIQLPCYYLVVIPFISLVTQILKFA